MWQERRGNDWSGEERQYVVRDDWQERYGLAGCDATRYGGTWNGRNGKVASGQVGSGLEWNRRQGLARFR